MAGKKKYVSAETKLAIVKAHLTGKTPISELSEKYGVPPSSIYQWQNQLLSSGASVFERKNDRRTGKVAALRYEQKIADLEAKLAAKNEVVGEIMEEMVKLKKLGGAT